MSVSLGEGRYDPAKVMKALYDNGYTGAMLDDHVPTLTNDTRWGHIKSIYLWLPKRFDADDEFTVW